MDGIQHLQMKNSRRKQSPDVSSRSVFPPAYHVVSHLPWHVGCAPSILWSWHCAEWGRILFLGCKRTSILWWFMVFQSSTLSDKILFFREKFNFSPWRWPDSFKRLRKETLIQPSVEQSRRLHISLSHSTSFPLLAPIPLTLYTKGLFKVSYQSRHTQQMFECILCTLKPDSFFL